MYLHDTLRICLLAVESRYPNHVIDLNERILGLKPFAATGWTAREWIALLSETEPDLLSTPAHLQIDEQRCEIYLTRYSLVLPAFWIHCHGKIPSHTGDLRAWLQDRLQTHASGRP